jgi:sugar phosphate isomerase/epimerase
MGPLRKGRRLAAGVDAAAALGIATEAIADTDDSWESALAKAASAGWHHIELSALSEEQLDALIGFLAGSQATIEPFERISVHAPVKLRTSAMNVLRTLARLPQGLDIVVHPDLYASEPPPPRLGRRLLFENMDVQKAFGRSVADLDGVFAAHPDAGFCLDVAHCWTNDPTLRLAHDLIDRFAIRLRQVHLSGIDPDGTHRPTTRDDLDLYGPVLARCRRVPWLLETAIRDG